MSVSDPVWGFGRCRFDERGVDDFSAVVLWDFRIVSLGLHAVLWTTIGLLFGFFAERALAHLRDQLYHPGVAR
jgi:hypothetical protein